MFLLRVKKRKRVHRRIRGQGITEYGAILAFVAVLVAMCFGIANGHLSGAVCAAFSSVAGQLNTMSTAVNNATS